MRHGVLTRDAAQHQATVGAASGGQKAKPAIRILQNQIGGVPEKLPFVQAAAFQLLRWPHCGHSCSMQHSSGSG